MYAVRRLADIYPNDMVRVVSMDALARALDAARLAALYAGGDCLDRKVSAAAALFTEIINGHPLSDGNKRLATLLLKAFLAVNGLKRPILYMAAIRVARGEWGYEEFRRWLRRELQ